MKRCLAIIPARSGSKELPHKNTRLLCEKPLMAYTIEAAHKSSIFSDVIVSTNSKRYADIAQSYGAWIPFLRDESLASDEVPLSKITVDVLQKLESMGHRYTFCCMLQPTCPLRTGDDIAQAYAFMNEKNADYVVSVSKKKHPAYTGGELSDSMSLENLIDVPYRNVSRQHMKAFYEISGAFCFMRVASYMKNQNIYTSKSYAYVISPAHALDIDTWVDFATAEVLLQRKDEMEQ